MKKVFYLLLLLATLILAEGAFAAETITSGDYEIRVLEDGTAEIAAYNGHDQELVIPSEIAGYKIISIAPLAFSKFRDFISVTLPDNLFKLDENSFFSCGKLEDIKISQENPIFAVIDGALINKETKTLVSFPAKKDAADYTIPQDITVIGTGAFFGCGTLEDVVLPEGLTTVESTAFAWCSNLKSVTFPESLTEIGKHGFSWCSDLTSVDLPESLNVLGDRAFFNCSSLASVYLPDSAFENSDIDSVFSDPDQITFTVDRDSKGQKWAAVNGYTYTFPVTEEYPEEVVIRSDYAINVLEDGTAEISRYKGKDTEIVVPAETAGYKITAIGIGAFYDHEELTSVTLPDTLRVIKREAFNSCTNLTTVNIPDSVTAIGEYVFYKCEKLTSIALPKRLGLLREEAFVGADNLTTVCMPDSPLVYDYIPVTNAFSNIDQITFIVEPNSAAQGWAEYYGYNFSHPNTEQ